jgi:hypothetical protein
MIWLAPRRHEKGIRLKSGAIPVAVKGLPKPLQRRGLREASMFATVLIQREGVEVNPKPEDLPLQRKQHSAFG